MLLATTEMYPGSGGNLQPYPVPPSLPVGLARPPCRVHPADAGRGRPPASGEGSTRRRRIHSSRFGARRAGRSAPTAAAQELLISTRTRAASGISTRRCPRPCGGSPSRRPGRSRSADRPGRDLDRGGQQGCRADRGQRRRPSARPRAAPRRARRSGPGRGSRAAVAAAAAARSAERPAGVRRSPTSGSGAARVEPAALAAPERRLCPASAGSIAASDRASPTGSSRRHRVGTRAVARPGTSRSSRAASPSRGR